MDQTPWLDWVGRSEVRTDRIADTAARALAATLDRADADRMRPGAELPGPWVWLYFLALTPSAQIASDGHPKRGGFLPPVDDLPKKLF